MSGSQEREPVGSVDGRSPVERRLVTVLEAHTLADCPDWASCWWQPHRAAAGLPDADQSRSLAPRDGLASSDEAVWTRRAVLASAVQSAAASSLVWVEYDAAVRAEAVAEERQRIADIATELATITERAVARGGYSEGVEERVETLWQQLGVILAAGSVPVATPAAEDVEPVPISPEFRQRLIAATERPLRVRRAVLLLAGHASGHLPGAEHACRTCHAHWPCEAVHRAAHPALEAFADCDASLAEPSVGTGTPAEAGWDGPPEDFETGRRRVTSRTFAAEVERLTAEVARYRAAIEAAKPRLSVLREHSLTMPHGSALAAGIDEVRTVLAAALGDGE